jgi:hypothetical protein
MDYLDKLMSKVEKQENGCWIYTGPKFKNGYGRFYYPDNGQFAHRFSYEHFNGSIPKGLQIDHLCMNKLCVNPEHLEAVTLQENIRRFNKTRTHCKRGHEFTKENTYLKNGNKRICRICNAMHGKAYQDSHKVEILAKQKAKRAETGAY